MRLPTIAALVAIAALAALGFTIAGCGGEDKSSDTRALVTFAKSGGIAGKISTLTVDRGGGAQLTTFPTKIKKFNIGGDKRDELVGLLEGFEDLESSYEPDSPIADAFRYSLTYEGKTVSASDGVKPPENLSAVIDLLDGIVDDES